MTSNRFIADHELREEIRTWAGDLVDDIDIDASAQRLRAQMDAAIADLPQDDDDEYNAAASYELALCWQDDSWCVDKDFS